MGRYEHEAMKNDRLIPRHYGLASDAMEKLERFVQTASTAGRRLLVLSGAGISEASGMPTYRGRDGMWVPGSPNYRSPSKATLRHYRENPLAAWQYSLTRLQLYLSLRPNKGHLAVEQMRNRLGSRFHLITQNVDSLHLKAGTPLDATYEIHGNLREMRCSASCHMDVYPIPEEILLPRDYDDPIPEAVLSEIRCPQCGDYMRPHVLWFDESYNEIYFRRDSSMRRVEEADGMLVIGTSLQTNLPKKLVRRAIERGIPMLYINDAQTSLSQGLESHPKGEWIKGTGEELLPALASILSDQS